MANSLILKIKKLIAKVVIGAVLMIFNTVLITIHKMSVSFLITQLFIRHDAFVPNVIVLTFAPMMLLFYSFYKYLFYEETPKQSFIFYLLEGIIEGGSQGIALIILVFFYENTQQYITMLYIELVSFVPFICYSMPKLKSCKLNGIILLISSIFPIVTAVIISIHYRFYWQIITVDLLFVAPYWRSYLTGVSGGYITQIEKHRYFTSFIRELTKIIGLIVGCCFVYYTNQINPTERWLINQIYLLPLYCSLLIPFILQITISWGMKAALPITTATLPMIISIIIALLLYLSTCHWYWIPEIFEGMCIYYAGDTDWWFVGCFIGVFVSCCLFCKRLVEQKRYINKTRDVWSIPDVCCISFSNSLLLNRRTDEIIQNEMRGSDEDTFKTKRIVICATMYHETEAEMTQLIKSFKRLDNIPSSKDHIVFCIIFDDSCTVDRLTLYFNLFAEQIIRLLYQERVKMEYKVQWFGAIALGVFKNGTSLTILFKDSHLIKKNKRYSQLMLFNYAIKTYGKEDTFILFTDGDTYFSPSSVRKLCLEISSNPRCGAISGRIYPDGKGVWASFQKFEYATSHWLQKPAEELLGSVLCCPGCFTLLRLEAIYEDNLRDKRIFDKYSEPPQSSIGILTHNFGEDRWLSYLLIEKGWELKYCSITKSKSYCPTTTQEFFNQRRRWLTSTWANLVMIIKNWMRIKRNNKKISTGFMIYTFLNFISSFTTPPTTLLLIYGLLVNLEIPYTQVIALALSVFPVLIFLIIEVVVHYLPAPSFEIWCINIISGIYGIEMLLVIVNLIYSLITIQQISINLIFCGALVIVYVITIVLHCEFNRIVGGIITIFLIPTTNILLIIYSFMHMSDVSWGTREQHYEGTLQKIVYAQNSDINYIDQISIFTPESSTEKHNKKMRSKLKKTQFITILLFFFTSLCWIILSLLLMFLDYQYHLKIIGISFSFMIVPTCLTILLVGVQFICMMFHRIDSLAFILSHSE
ncbi:hypothetical protein ENUP19_0340G0063 [Entamoeba nuttalli]